MKQKYVDSYYSETQNRFEQTICYRTGMACYEEGMVSGVYFSMGWMGSGYVPQQITWPSVPRMDYCRFTEGSAFSIQVNGQELNSHWNFISYDKQETEKGLLVTVRLSHQIAGIDVAIRTLLDGTPVLTRWLELTNTKEAPALLADLSVMSGGLQITPRFKSFLNDKQSLYRLGYMECVSWGLEGMFRWHDLPNAGYYVRGKFGRDRFRHPMFILENNATGEHFICQLGYSGGWKFDFDLDEDIVSWAGSGNANLSFKISLDGFSPLITIASGETLSSPEVHLGLTFGSLDDAVNSMHDHIRRSVMMPQPIWNSPIECGLGPEMDMEQPALLRSIDYAAEHGLENYIIDAGWFQPAGKAGWGEYMGDWFPEGERYELGLARIREICHEKGLKFGLWMEVERISHMCRLFEEHKDYLANTYTDPLSQKEMPNAGPLALYKKEVADWVEDQIDRLISHYQLDVFRLDHNEIRRSYDYRDGAIVNGEYRYMINLYKIFDRMRAKYPDVVFENCASGGGRTDLGMMSRMSHSWVTDWQHAPRSFAILNGLSMCLPPEYIDRLLGAQSGHIEGTFEFQARQMLFGRPTINAATVCGREENTLQSEKLDHILEIYRTVVRPMHHKNCKVYHHTPELDPVEPKGMGILELAAEDGSSAIAGIFNLAASAGTTETRFYFYGVDIAKDYWLAMDNSRSKTKVSGFTLKNEGVLIRLGGALDCELLVATQINP